MKGTVKWWSVEKALIWALAWLPVVAWADAVQFSENYSQRLRAYRDEGETFYEQVASVGFSASGSITLPGLASNALNTLEGFHVAIGVFNFGAGIEEATSRSANQLAFNITKEVEFGDEIRTVTVGSILLERRGDVLSFTMSASNLPDDFYIVGGDHTEPDEKAPLAPLRARGQTQFVLNLGEFSFQRTLYYGGTATFRRQSVGSGEFIETYTLATVNITGTADYTRPTLGISFPAALQRLTNSSITVRGTAADNGEVATVFLRVNGEDAEAFYDSEPGTWTAAVELRAGTNTLEAYVVDAEENWSATVRSRCVLVVLDTLHLDIGPGGTVEGVTNGQRLEIGRGYSARARPGPTNLFSSWTSSVAAGVSTNPALGFLMSTGLALEARFIPNPWIPSTGSFHGVFLPATGATPTNAGAMMLQLGARGKLTGKLTQGASSRAFTGQLGLDGSAVISLPRPPALTLRLGFDLTNGTGTVEGTVTGPSWESPLRLVRRGLAPALAGRHTFAIPGAPAAEAATHPAGDGVGVITISAGGAVTASGELGDGTPLLFTSGASRDGEVSVHAALHGGRGLFIGWMHLSTQAAPLMVTGEGLTWFKPGGLVGPRTYPGGFTELKSLQGARYSSVRATNALNWTNGLVLLDGGKLSETLSNAAVRTGARLTAPGATNGIVITLNPATGRFGGTFLHPVTRVGTALRGVVIQQSAGDMGRGWFRDMDQSGYVELHPLAP